MYLGSIRGVVAAVGVGSTAFGPLLFALGRDLTGSYQAVLLGSAVLPVLVAVAGFSCRPPGQARPGASAQDQTDAIRAD